MTNRVTNPGRLYRVLIRFTRASERDPQEVVFDNALSWRIEGGFASVRTTEDRIFAYNIDEVSSFEVPFIPPPPEEEEEGS